jgi:hypothetical protein
MTGPTLQPVSSYTQDQITVRYVGNSLPGGIITDYQPNGSRSWYNFGQGANYVEISTPFLLSGMQVAIGTGWSRNPTTNFQMLRGTTVLAEGSFPSLKVHFEGYDLYSFSGGLFDTLRLSSTTSGAAVIGDWVFDSSSLDDIGVSRAATGAVPEPQTWAMLILGLGLVGHAARHRGRKLAGAAGSGA